MAGQAGGASPQRFWMQDHGGICDGFEVRVRFGIADQDVVFLGQADHCIFETVRAGSDSWEVKRCARESGVMENLREAGARASRFSGPYISLFQKLSMDPLTPLDGGAAVRRRSGREQGHDSLCRRRLAAASIQCSREFGPDVAAKSGIDFLEKQIGLLIAARAVIAASQGGDQVAGGLGCQFRRHGAGVGIDSHDGGIGEVAIGVVQQHNRAGTASDSAIGCAGEVIGNDQNLWRHGPVVLSKRIRYGVFR
jgi:hypothetical protein